MNNLDDNDLLRRQRHFLVEVERDVRQMNRTIIHERVPPLEHQCFIDLSRMVARKRATYLYMALELSRCVPDSEQEAALLRDISGVRHAYTEAREAFASLERAIEAGYVDIAAS